MAKKIVYVSDSESDSDDKLPRPSFISGQISRNLNNINNSHVNKQINSDFQKKKKATSTTCKNKEPDEGTSVTTKNDDEEIICLSDRETSPRAPKRLAQHQKEISPQKAFQCDDDEPEIIEINTSPRDHLTENITDLNLDEQSMISNETRPMRIKMKRLDRIESFSILPSQPISAIFDDIGQKFNILVPNIILYLKDTLVEPKATPISLKLTVADFFDVLSRAATTSQLTSDSTTNDPNFIKLHLRDNTKKRITLRINRFQIVKDLAEHYAKEKDVLLNNVVLEFDCERMSFDKKIDYYDMDNDDQIDVIVKE